MMKMNFVVPCLLGLEKPIADELSVEDLIKSLRSDV